jgi:hypothetical protein
MASTYSDLKIELIGTGEQSGTWGTTTNTNLGTAIEEAITGSADISFSSADVTLTLTDTNTTQSARNLRLNLTGTSGGARVLTVPAIEKQYIINNGLADAVTVTPSGGTGIAVPAGKTMVLFNDGTDMQQVTTHASSLTLGTDLAIADGGTGASDSSTARTNLGLGSMAVQNATAINVSGGTIVGITDLTIADGGTGASTASDARTNLGVAIGTDVQAYDADLQAISNLAKTDGNIIVGNGTTWVAESGATARTSLGLGSLATLNEVNAATIADNSVGADELNVSGDGTSGQALLSDGDGTFSWGAASVVSETTGSAPYYGARAWASINEPSAVLQSSANISSLTDNGTGDFTLTFTTAMPDTNYSVVFGSSVYQQNQVRVTTLDNSSARATGSVRIQSYYIAGGGDTVTIVGDFNPVSVAIFR